MLARTWSDLSRSQNRSDQRSHSGSPHSSIPIEESYSLLCLNEHVSVPVSVEAAAPIIFISQAWARRIYSRKVHTPTQPQEAKASSKLMLQRGADDIAVPEIILVDPIFPSHAPPKEHSLIHVLPYTVVWWPHWAIYTPVTG